MTNKKKLGPISEDKELTLTAKNLIATYHETASIEEEIKNKREKEQDQIIKNVQQITQKAGNAQAFKAISELTDFLYWKAIADIVDNRKVLESMGFSTIDEYLESVGVQRRTAYNNLKIVRNLAPEECATLAQVGLTKRSLLGLAGLPPEKRPKIVNGKLENYENADQEGLKEIIENLVAEHKAKERLVEQKQRSFDASVKREAKLQEELDKAKASLNDDRKRLYGDVILNFKPEDQRAIEQLHYAHDQFWLALTAISSVDVENCSIAAINIAAQLCEHISKMVTENYNNFMTSRPEIGVLDHSVEEYWERLPFNARAKKK